MSVLKAIVRLLLVATLAALTPLHAAETNTLARIGAQLEQHAVIRAEFTQRKQMAAMKRPLLTSGRLVLSRQHGVLWQIEQPLRISYVLGEERIVEIGADGARRERGVRDVPGLAQVSRVFRAMLGADSAALREQFDAAAHGDPAQWEIILTPRNAQLAQFLTRLQLSGGRFVSDISIVEAGGDTTQINFHHTQGSNALSDTELQLFGVDQTPSAKPAGTR